MTLWNGWGATGRPLPRSRTMTLLVWTQLPDAALLRQATKQAVAFRFGDRQGNKNLVSEISSYAFRVNRFISSASAEALVNLAHGLPWKVAAFKRQLEIDQQAAVACGEEIDIYDYLLKALGTKVGIPDLPEDSRDVLTSSNPCLLVCNHAYPPFDGLAALSLMSRFRNQIGIMVNSNNCLLRVFPEYSGSTIQLHMEGGLLGSFDKNEVRRSQLSALKRAVRELTEGGCVTVFPAGQGSKAERWGDLITDLPWLSGVGQIVAHFNKNGRQLDIVPLHFVGHMGTPKNSRRYQWAAIERPTWLPAALQLALFNPPPVVSLRVGSPITAASLDGLPRDSIIEMLRNAVFDLGDEAPIAVKGG